MITILTIIEDKDEYIRLRQTFLKVNIRAIPAEPSYASYLKTLQYDPDIVIMEVPANPKSHVQFLRLIRNNKGIAQKPFILFGPDFDARIIEAFRATGADSYLKKPLDLKNLFEIIKKLLLEHSASKSGVNDKNQLSKVEVAALYDASISKHKKINIMLNHIGKLLAFPATVASILRVTQNEKSGARELAQIIQSDPSVATEVLKVANSVFFARRSNSRIVDLKEAVVRIGFIQTKNTAMSLSVFQIMKDRNYETGFNHIDFWFHCLGVAVISERLAKHSGLVPLDEGFIAGLLHDMGKLLLNEFFNDIFLSIIEKTTSEGVPFNICHEQILGFNQNELLLQLFEQWNFPESIIQNVMFFGGNDTLNAASLKERPLASIVNIAETIAKSLQVGRETDCCVSAIPEEVFDGLRMHHGLSQGFIDGIYNEMNLYNQFLKIDKRSFPLTYEQIKDAEKVMILCHSFSKEPFNPIVEYLKTQRYKIVISKNRKDVEDTAASYHAFIVTDGSGAVFGDIEQISGLKVQMFSAANAEAKKNDSTNRDPVFTNAKMIVFDIKKDIASPFSNKNTIVSKYPVDLRNVDFVLAALLHDFPIDSSLNAMGALKPVKKISVAGKSKEKRRILVCHSKSDIRKIVRDAMEKYPETVMEEADDGLKAFNRARTTKEEIFLVIIQLCIPMMESFEVIKGIRELPNHKRAKFIVCFDTAQKEQLIPLVRVGVRDFIKESDLGQKIPLWLQ